MDTSCQYTVLFRQTEEGIIIASVPALRGCVSYGNTQAEAEKNIQEAIELYIEGLQELGEEVPIENNRLFTKQVLIRRTA